MQNFFSSTPLPVLVGFACLVKGLNVEDHGLSIQEINNRWRPYLECLKSYKNIARRFPGRQSYRQSWAEQALAYGGREKMNLAEKLRDWNTGMVE